MVSFDLWGYSTECLVEWCPDILPPVRWIAVLQGKKENFRLAYLYLEVNKDVQYVLIIWVFYGTLKLKFKKSGGIIWSMQGGLPPHIYFFSISYYLNNFTSALDPDGGIISIHHPLQSCFIRDASSKKPTFQKKVQSKWKKFFHNANNLWFFQI
jgi:hypothetical protein